MTTLSKDIAELNDYSLVSYLKVLGYEPVSELPGSTTFELYLGKNELIPLVIDHKTNRFIDKANNCEGSLVDFACMKFGITPNELIRNIMPYRIDLLMDEEARRAISVIEMSSLRVVG